MSDRKAVIKNADMSQEMQQDAVNCATQVPDFTLLRGPYITHLPIYLLIAL